MAFTPDKEFDRIEVPWFDEVSTEKHGLRGHKTGKTVEKLQNEIRATVGKLGGGVIGFIPGHTTDNGKTRHGYRVKFTLHGMPGHIDVMALPLKSGIKSTSALKQALYMTWKALEGYVFLKVLQPEIQPLLPYLLDEKGRTFSEAVFREKSLPMLAAGSEFVEGEYVD